MDRSWLGLTEVVREELSSVLHSERSWSSVGDSDLNDEAFDFREFADDMAIDNKRLGRSHAVENIDHLAMSS